MKPVGLLSGTVDLLMGTGTHDFDLLSLGGALSADKLSGSTLGFGGTVQLSLLAGSNPLKGGDTFDLFDGTLSGSFAGIDATGLGLATGLELDTSAMGSTGMVTVIPEPTALSMLMMVAMGSGLFWMRRRSSIL